MGTQNFLSRSSDLPLVVKSILVFAFVREDRNGKGDDRK